MLLQLLPLPPLGLRRSHPLRKPLLPALPSRPLTLQPPHPVVPVVQRLTSHMKMTAFRRKRVTTVVTTHRRLRLHRLHTDMQRLYSRQELSPHHPHTLFLLLLACSLASIFLGRRDAAVISAGTKKRTRKRRVRGGCQRGRQRLLLSQPQGHSRRVFVLHMLWLRVGWVRL